MSVEDAPEHPVVAGGRGGAARHLDDLLGVIILDGIVARELDHVVAHDALAAVDEEGLLVAAEALSRLLRRHHLKHLATVVVRVFRKRSFPCDGAGVELSRVDHQRASRCSLLDLFQGRGQGVETGAGRGSSRRAELAALHAWAVVRD